MWISVLLIATAIARSASSQGAQYLTTVDGTNFYKIPGDNVREACEAVGMKNICHQSGFGSCTQAWTSDCISYDGLGVSCWSHEILSETLCGHTDASRCQPLDDTFVYIPNWLSNSSAYGVDYQTNSAILLGSDYDFNNKYALCAIFDCDVYGDKCYRFSDDSLSHKEASTVCTRMGGQLVDIKDTSDHQTLAHFNRKTPGTSHWTSIKSPSPNVVHPDGSTLSAVSPWMSDNLYGPFDVCVLLDSTNSYKGDYRACTEEHNYVCEAPVVFCDQNVCQNGGTCTSCFSGGAFMCSCLPGYSGVSCETAVGARTSSEYCAESPCGLGWHCKEDGPSGYSCISG